jgi:hypothetical protein
VKAKVKRRNEAYRTLLVLPSGLASQSGSDQGKNIPGLARELGCVQRQRFAVGSCRLIVGRSGRLLKRY